MAQPTSTIFNDEGFLMANQGVTVGNYFADSIAQGITAAGSTALTATPLTSQFNIVSVGVAATGVRLPAVTNLADMPPGTEIAVISNGGTVITVYPPTGGKLNGGSVDAGITIAATAGSVARFVNTGSLAYQKSM